VGDHEVWAGPLDGQPRPLQLLETRVVRTIARRTVRVEHHPHRDAASMGVDESLEETRFAQGELFDTQRRRRIGHERQHGVNPVIRLYH